MTLQHTLEQVHKLVAAGIVALDLNTQQAVAYQVPMKDGTLLVNCAAAEHELDLVQWPATSQPAESELYAALGATVSAADAPSDGVAIYSYGGRFVTAVGDVNSAVKALAGDVGLEVTS